MLQGGNTHCQGGEDGRSQKAQQNPMSYREVEQKIAEMAMFLPVFAGQVGLLGQMTCILREAYK